MFKVLDLFAGIGGFTLGMERTGGFETVAFCEIEEYPQKVLKKNWPYVPIYPDVTKLTCETLEADGIRPDVITGGFPCQDISVEGKGAGIDGERSGLWSEIARLVGEIRPRYAIMENVSALLRRGLDRVLGDLAEIGYDAEWHCITAASVGAPHRRDRIWIVAYPNSTQRERGWLSSGIQTRFPTIDGGSGNGDASKDVANTTDNGRALCCIKTKESGTPQGTVEGGSLLADTLCQRQPGQGELVERSSETKDREGEAGNVVAVSEFNQWRVEPNVGRVANGVPNRAHRLRCLGNAVVPQIPQLIGQSILEYEKTSPALRVNRGGT